jgi:uncharacterized protein
MELEHTFTVPVPPDEAFRILRDIARIGPCMPGATIESVDGDEFTGKVKVKVGPIQVTYQGRAAFVEVDEVARTATIEAKGKEARGPGTANATIRASCESDGDGTSVKVVTDLAVTGRPAQFGRGVMADVGDKLLGKFADCLAEELAGEEPGAAAEGAATAAAGEQVPVAAEPAAAAAAAPLGTPATAPAVAEGAPVSGADRETGPAGQTAQRRTEDTIDLLDVAGGPVLQRAAPVLAALAVLALIVWLVRRRRS